MEMKPETRSFYEVAVHRALERVVVSLDEALDLEALARVAALSPFHFHRIFRGMVGETPLELQRRLRMERAAFELLHTDTPVTSLAFEARYDTHESFTRAFRNRYGCSPSAFRQSREKDAEGCARPYRVELASRSGIHFTGKQLDPSTAALFFERFVEGDQIMDVVIKTMKELRTATVRHVGPYNRISEAFAKLGEAAGRAGLIHTKPLMLAIYHDDPETTDEGELRSDAAIAIPDGVPLPAGLEEVRVVGGRYASTTHNGSYATLGDTWSRLMGQWLPKSGERLGDSVSYEIYVNNPMEVPEAELVTELYIPLS